MSAPRLRVELAQRAKRDIRSIRQYTVSQWGVEQADTYLSALNKGIEALRGNPHIGMARDDLRPGLRSFAIESHRVLYRVVGETIRIVRIVHLRKDLSQEKL